MKEKQINKQIKKPKQTNIQKSFKDINRKR
jgi:hypothetical protein